MRVSYSMDASHSAGWILFLRKRLVREEGIALEGVAGGSPFDVCEEEEADEFVEIGGGSGGCKFVDGGTGGGKGGRAESLLRVSLAIDSPRGGTYRGAEMVLVFGRFCAEADDACPSGSVVLGLVSGILGVGICMNTEPSSTATLVDPLPSLLRGLLPTEALTLPSLPLAAALAALSFSALNVNFVVLSECRNIASNSMSRGLGLLGRPT